MSAAPNSGRTLIPVNNWGIKDICACFTILNIGIPLNLRLKILHFEKY